MAAICTVILVDQSREKSPAASDSFNSVAQVRQNLLADVLGIHETQAEHLLRKKIFVVLAIRGGGIRTCLLGIFKRIETV